LIVIHNTDYDIKLSPILGTPPKKEGENFETSQDVFNFLLNFSIYSHEFSLTPFLSKYKKVVGDWPPPSSAGGWPNPAAFPIKAIQIFFVFVSQVSCAFL